VNPQNREHIYLLSVGMSHSTDGGRTWSSPFGFGGDNHALWINPRDPNHMLLGHDHGMGVTFDGGNTWLQPDNKPLAQYYAVTGKGADAVAKQLTASMEQRRTARGRNALRKWIRKEPFFQRFVAEAGWKTLTTDEPDAS